jgi:CRP/FNR family transcriptional regulator
VKPEHIPLVSALAQTAIFKGIPLDGLERLAEQGQVNRFESGSPIMRQGDASESLHVILKGRVRVDRVQPDLDEPLFLAEFGPGEVVGEMGVLEGAPRSATVTAVHETETLGLTADALASTLSQYPTTAGALMRILSERIRRTDQLVAKLMRGEPVPRAESEPADERSPLALQTVTPEFIENLKAAIRMP